MIHVAEISGGGIAVNTPVAPTGHPDTRFILQDGTVKSHDIVGTIDYDWLDANEYYEPFSQTWLVDNIVEADFGNALTSIGDGVFQRYTSLITVTIPGSVKTIGENAFLSCNNLENVTLNEGLESIGTWAFHQCKKITSIVIPNTMTSIGESAFGYTGLVDVNVPAQVANIGENAFAGCNGLEIVTFGGFDETTLKSMISDDHILGWDFQDDQFNPIEKTVQIAFPGGSFTAEFHTNYTITFGE